MARQIGHEPGELEAVAEGPAQQIGRGIADGRQQLLLHVVRGDGWIGRPQHEPIDGRLQLPDVAGPRVPQQKVSCSGRKGLLLDTGLVGELAVRRGQKVIHERRQVARALTEGRQSDHAGGEPVVQVLAEPAGRHLGAQVAVRGGDDPDVDGDRAIGPQPADGPLLHHAQELHLRGQRELADLVEKERAAGRGLEVSGAGAVRARERAPLVAEEQRLDEPVRQRAAVDLLERAAQAAAAGVDRPREQLLAGSGLALDQDGDIVRRHPLRARPRPDQQRTAADDAFECGGCGRQARAQAGELLVRFPQQRRHVLGRDVERHGHRADAGLRVRLDQLGGMAGLGEENPHRLHGGGPGADVYRQVGVGTVRVPGEVECPDRRPVDGSIVGRIVQGLRPEVNGRRARRGQPVREPPVSFGRVVREEHQPVEGTGRYGAGDGTAAGPLPRRAVEVRLTDPGQQHRRHTGIINFLSANRSDLVRAPADQLPDSAVPVRPR